jgi:VIT family
MASGGVSASDDARNAVDDEENADPEGYDRIDRSASMCLAVTLALTAVALITGGMVVGRLTGRPVLRSGLRQLAFAALAIAVAYLVGSLIGGHGG